MEQKAIALRESYDLYSNGELKYFIRRRKLLTSKPTYDIFTESGTVGSASVTETAAPLIFALSFNGENAGEVVYEEIPGVHRLTYKDKGITVEGNNLLTEFNVKNRDKKIIGTVKKKIVSLKDTYDIDFVNDEDELLFAMLALLIDETFHG